MSLSGWTSAVQTAKNQLYISRSLDPFTNLSIEHFLLTKSAKYSNVCFIYTNRPCVVIGRNQNPWFEVNFSRLKSPEDKTFSFSNGRFRQDKLLVRRRSGGGTVFHDEGNVNYSVMCPPDQFTRDKHAEMVTQAIRTFNPRARVNQRHDIVLDQGEEALKESQPQDMHSTQYESDDPRKPPLKISGSAFKLIKNRALHHGTCLLNSDRLSSIGQFLHSAARPFITAKGVESVRSPVGNAIPRSESQTRTNQILHLFPYGVLSNFQTLYGVEAQCMDVFRQRTKSNDDVDVSSIRYSAKENDWVAGMLGEDVKYADDIEKGIRELTSKPWIFDQTPQFTLDSHPKESAGPQLPVDFPANIEVHLAVRHGEIHDATLTCHLPDTNTVNPDLFSAVLSGKLIRTVPDFEKLFVQQVPNTEQKVFAAIGRWLNLMFGNGGPDGRVPST